MRKFNISDTLQKVKDKANHAMLAVSVSVMSAPAFSATYDVSDLVDEFDSGEAPVATMASASIELLIIRRIWKIIQRSI